MSTYLYTLFSSVISTNSHHCLNNNFPDLTAPKKVIKTKFLTLSLIN